jgi:hypothetical protein
MVQAVAGAFVCSCCTSCRCSRNQLLRGLRGIHMAHMLCRTEAPATMTACWGRL